MDNYPNCKVFILTIWGQSVKHAMAKIWRKFAAQFIKSIFTKNDLASSLEIWRFKFRVQKCICILQFSKPDQGGKARKENRYRRRPEISPAIQAASLAQGWHKNLQEFLQWMLNDENFESLKFHLFVCGFRKILSQPTADQTKEHFKATEKSIFLWASSTFEKVQVL